MSINIIVTSGGTEEYIDDVRVLTNISTGKLGFRIAEQLSNIKNVKILYVHSRNAVKPPYLLNNIFCYEVRTANDTLKILKNLITENEINAVVHAMAVSDFTFKKDSAVKLKSNDAEGFINYMRNTIIPNPKIISHIKEWDPNIILIGFKFEVGSTPEKLKELAKESIEKNKCDLIIANDKEEIKRHNTHVGHFVYSKKMKNKLNIKYKEVFGKENISNDICKFITDILKIKI